MQNVFRFLKRICFSSFAFMCLSGIPAYSQTTKITGLEQQLRKSLTDTARLRLLRALSVEYSTVDPIKKFTYSKRYKNLAEKLEIDSIVAEGYIDMGISYGIQSRLDSALFYFSKGYDKGRESNSPKAVARSLISIGFSYARLDDKQGAVEKYREALVIFRKLKSIRGINQCYINIGSIYFDMGEYQSAESYFMASYRSYMEAKDASSAAGPMFSLGNTNRMLGRLDKAEEFYTRSLKIREKNENLNGTALARWGLGMIAVERKQYDEALRHLDIAMQIDLRLKDIYHQTAVLKTISEAYLGKKEYKKALFYAKDALARSKSIHSAVGAMEALKLLTKVSEVTNDIPKAYLYQTHYLTLRDSLKSEQATNDIKIAEFERVQSENEGLLKDNESIVSTNTSYLKTILIISGLLIIVIFLSLMLYRRNKEKNATNQLLARQKEEIAKINEELADLNKELTTQMRITAAQNDELEKLNVVKNKFFSIVSHDLRSPLATLQMLFRLYRRGQLNEMEMDEMLNALEETIYMTSVFLDNLLNWSKSQLEGMAVKPSSFDAGNLISENIRLMETQIRLKELQVDNKIDGKRMAYADENMINVVVRNLLSNSVKFCSPGDSITFDATEGDGKIILSVRDTGPGITESDLEHLFDLEHTVSMGTSGETGHHIGLILCHDMIELNNGTIEVESKTGKGTTFRVVLPAGKDL